MPGMATIQTPLDDHSSAVVKPTDVGFAMPGVALTHGECPHDGLIRKSLPSMLTGVVTSPNSLITFPTCLKPRPV